MCQDRGAPQNMVLVLLVALYTNPMNACKSTLTDWYVNSWALLNKTTYTHGTSVGRLGSDASVGMLFGA